MKLVMDVSDAKNVIKDLQEKPFICGQNTIETESGYVITKKAKKLTNADRIRSMSDEELLDFICSIETYDDGSVKIIEGGSALCSVTDVENWIHSEVEK